MIEHISAVLIVKNEEKTLARCLDSLTEFGEVVIYFNNTSDSSREVAAKYSNVMAQEGEFRGFGETRNLAAHYASNDWIFCIDADEELDREAVRALYSWKPSTEARHIGSFLRHNIVMGRNIRGGLWRPVYKLRLYNRAICKWVKPVHEEIVGDNAAEIKLLGSIIHHVNIRQEKVHLYTSLENKQNRSLFFALLGGCFTFFRTYILQLGFIDGKVGLYCATYLFRYHMAKYYKKQL